MPSTELFHFNINKIRLAHEHTLDEYNRCEYLQGRGLYGLVLPLSGDAEYRFTNGERKKISPGDVFVISANAAYSIIKKCKFKHYTLNFDIHEDSSNTEFLKGGYCSLRTENHEQYRQIFKKLTVLWQAKSAGYEMRLLSYAYEMLSMFLTELYETTHTTQAHRRLFPSKEFIEQNFDKDFSLEMLAKISDMSITNYRREWTKAYKETPLQYRDRLRISYAKDFLLSGYYSISEVGARCGFKDTSYFVRFFKKHTGISPGNYKKSSVVL